MDDSATGKKRALSPALSQRQQQQQQQDDPPPDMLDALEYVVRIGNHWKHEALRIQAWREKNLETTTTAAEASDSDISYRSDHQHDEKQGKSKNSAKTKHENDLLLLHAQDIRLYSTKEWVENDPWPSKKKRKLQQANGAAAAAIDSNNNLRPDNDWDQELGDGIHPVAFTVTRLAKSPPSDLLNECASMDLDPDNNNNNNNASTECNIKPEHACKAVLQRCWERAVHASASTLPMTDKLPSKPYDFMHSMSAAKARCKGLGMELRKELKCCPCCDAEFTDTKLLDNHYYGTKETRGCSWNLIEKEEQRIIEHILTQEVEGQLDSLLHLIVSKAASKKQEMSDNNNNNKNTATLMNWKDILEMLQSSLDSSREVHHQEALQQQDHHPLLLETLDVDHNGIPLLINSTMMSSLRRRLEQRYSDSPR